MINSRPAMREGRWIVRRLLRVMPVAPFSSLRSRRLVSLLPIGDGVRRHGEIRHGDQSGGGTVERTAERIQVGAAQDAGGVAIGEVDFEDAARREGVYALRG